MMLKAYYTLEEAAKYLSDKNEDLISKQDVLELAARDRIRLCHWFDGKLLRFEQCLDDPTNYEVSGQSIINVRGYIQIPSYMVDIKAKEVNLAEIAFFETVWIGVNPHPEKPTPQRVMSPSDYKSWKEPWYSESSLLAPFRLEPVSCCDKDEAELPRVSVKRETLKISMIDCLVPTVDVEALLEGNPDESKETLAKYAAARKYNDGLTINHLKLHSWPLIKGNNSTITNALNRSSKWVKGAIVGNYPKLVNPAVLAFIIQDSKKSSLVEVTGNTKQLGNYLAVNFPSFLDEYESMTNFGLDP